jgi:hypothetical protein
MAMGFGIIDLDDLFLGRRLAIEDVALLTGV